MSEITILRDLAVVIIAAGIAALAFEHLRLSKILGYLLAGVLIGPHAFALIQNDATTRTLSDLGILFLMFSLGLEFNLRKLRRMGSTAVVIAVLDVVVMMWIGYELGRALGLGAVESVFLGAIVSDSSTTILTKTLKDMDKMREKFANIIFSATIVEDVIAIGIIAMLTGVASTGTFQAAGMFIGLARLVIFMVVLVVVGLLVVPRLLVRVAKFRSEELLVICVLALVFGISLLAVTLQYSLALGAFLIGAIAAESRLVGRVELLVAPFRHMFGAAFFIAVGMMIQPDLLVRYPLAIFGIAALVIVGKTVNCSLGAFLTGNDLRNSFRAGLGMAQICEFAFIIATLGLSLKVVSPAMYQVAVGVSVLTMLANPFLLRYADRLADAIVRFIPRGALANMRLYGQGVRRMASQYRDNPVRKTVRRSVWVILINMVFVAAIFIAAAYMAGIRPLHLPEFLTILGGRKTVFWVGAVLLSLPFFVATARKMHALGMILAEVVLPSSAQTPSANNVRMLIASLMLFVGILSIALLTFVLSSTLLPSWNVVIAVLLLVAMATWLGWRSLIKLYSRAQSAVQEIFSRDLPPPKPQAVPAMIGALMDRDLEAVDIGSDSPAAGKAVQDLRIRTQTGATIVSIERGREVILNLDANLRIEAGDKVLLLGSPDQTDAARKLLAGL
jgi:monovalent cation:H+ antiporter-2, CPA2 family